MNQSAMSRAIQCIFISIIYSYIYLTNLAEDSKNSETVLRQIRKSAKKPPLRLGQKKYLETYSLSNAAARDPEERAFFNQFTQLINYSKLNLIYTNRNIILLKKNKVGEHSD